MSNIRLSPKYGLNPSLSICFFCLQQKNEIVIPGLLKGDREAPKKAVWDKAPCDTCKEIMKQGVIFVSVNEKLTDDMNNPYRSGGWCAIKDEAVKRFVTDKKMLKDILKQRVCFVPDDAWEKIGLPK